MWLFRTKAKRERGPGAASSSPPDVATTPTAQLSSSYSGASNEGNPYSKYNLRSPPQGKHSRDMPAAELEIRKDGFRRFLRPDRVGSDETKMLVFLYGRGFMARSAKSERKARINEMVFGTKDAAERLLRVVEADGDRDVTKRNKDLYVKNCMTLQHYFEQEGAFGFLKNMDAKKDYDYFFRIQKSGNCFLNAPCILLAYLLKKLGFDGVFPVDVSKLVRRSFSDQELYEYIVKDNGGCSLDILTKLLQPLVARQDPLVSITLGVQVRETDFDLEKEMAKSGPGLVAEFNCPNNFNYYIKSEENKDKVGYVQFDGNRRAESRFVELKADDSKADEEKEEIEVALNRYMASVEESDPECPPPRRLHGESTSAQALEGSKGSEGSKNSYHSMVLIGGRRDANKKKWLLLQNWWEDMQLIEVSDEYFKSCGGRLAFVHETFENVKDLSLESCYSMNQFRVAECNNLDRPENPETCYRRLPRERSP